MDTDLRGFCFIMVKQRHANILRRLQYFEATARLGSVSKAAEELGVTASAVSHQLAELKRTVGEELFSKSGRGIALTEPGKLLADRVATAFRMLDTSVADVIGGEVRPIVQVAACSSFGPFWLVPRIFAFTQNNPGIDIDFRLYARDPELTQASADCIITAQDVKPGYASIDLFAERSFAVAAPCLVEENRLDAVALITTDTDDTDFAADWKSYAASRRKAIDVSEDRDWVRCSHYILALEAAKSGLGMALIPDFVSASAVRDGQLVDVGLGDFNNEGRVYRVCYKEERQMEPALKLFVGWLKRASRSSLAEQPGG